MVSTRSDVAGLLRDLYFDAPTARAVLIEIGYPAAQLPAFQSAAAFWPEVVLHLDSGIVVDGVREVVAVAVRDHPGNTRAAELLAKVGGATGAGTTTPIPVSCLFSDPVRGSKIRIDREARQFREIEDLGGIRVLMRHAVRTTDIVRALLQDRPRILHVGGHGTTDGRLVFEDEQGGYAVVDAAVLAEAIAATGETLDCVVLNSCFTGANAQAFRGATRAVAGSVTALADGCALAFARGFYTAIGVGQPVEKAFEAGRADAGLAQCDTSGLHFESFPPSVA